MYTMSKTSVIDTFHAADRLGVAWKDAEGMTNDEAYAMLLTSRINEDRVYPNPDWERLHRELAREGVTLKCLHDEYRDEGVGKRATLYVL